MIRRVLGSLLTGRIHSQAREVPKRRLPPVATILAGTLGGQGAIILVSPLLSRLYSPADFGALATITAIASVLGSVSTLGWESAVPLPKSDRLAGALVLLAFCSGVVISVLLAIVCLAFGEEFAAILHVELLDSAWWLLPITTLSIAVYFAMSSWFVRRSAFGVLARRNGVQGIIQATWSVGLGLAGVAPLGLASSLAAGRSAGLVGLGLGGLASAWGQPRGLFLRLIVVGRRYKRFPMVVTWARLVNGIGLQLPVLLVGALYGSVALGLLALTLRVLASPVGMVADATSQYFESTFASRLRSGAGGLSRMIVKVSARLALVGVVPTLAVAVAGPQIYEFVFGAQWGIAGDFASIVVVGYLAQLIVSPISKTLNLLQRQGTQLTWDIARAIAVGGSILIPASLGMSIEFTLVALTATQVTAYTALLALSLLASRRQDEAVVSMRDLDPGDQGQEAASWQGREAVSDRNQ